MGLSIPLDGVSADAVIFCESVSAVDKPDLNLFIIVHEITEFEIGQFSFLSLDPDSQTAGAGRRDRGALESDSVFGVFTHLGMTKSYWTQDGAWRDVMRGFFPWPALENAKGKFGLEIRSD